jgi:biotin transporter BioY
VSKLALLVPLLAAALCGWLFYRLNRRRRWFTIGELIFWNIILLVVLQLVWLIWF